MKIKKTTIKRVKRNRLLTATCKKCGGLLSIKEFISNNCNCKL